MSRLTPLVILFALNKLLACGGAVEGQARASSECCNVVKITSASGTGEVLAATVHDCSATPPGASCLPYQGSDVYRCAAQVGPGAFVPGADGAPEFCF